jgi:hypothetical protein
VKPIKYTITNSAGEDCTAEQRAKLEPFAKLTGPEAAAPGRCSAPRARTPDLPSKAAAVSGPEQVQPVRVRGARIVTKYVDRRGGRR